MIWDVHLGPQIRILIFTHPGSGIQESPDSGSQIRNTVNAVDQFLRKYLPCMTDGCKDGSDSRDLWTRL